MFKPFTLLLLAVPLLAQREEFVADPMPTASCHASTIVDIGIERLTRRTFHAAIE
jgi:hypothetical protein